jgi:hypothetical protein
MDFSFLLFSLFFPRIVMVVYLLQGWYPANLVPNWADILLGIFAPRILILIYIFQNMGYDNIWFAAHLVVMILAYFGGGVKPDEGETAVVQDDGPAEERADFRRSRAESLSRPTKRSSRSLSVRIFAAVSRNAD